jgi:hypothetical protein
LIGQMNHGSQGIFDGLRKHTPVLGKTILDLDIQLYRCIVAETGCLYPF